MESGELSAEQFDQIFQNARHLRDYLVRIERRMEVLSFPVEDELRRATRELDRAITLYVSVVLRLQGEAWRRSGYDELGPKPKRSARRPPRGPHPLDET